MLEYCLPGAFPGPYTEEVVWIYEVYPVLLSDPYIGFNALMDSPPAVHIIGQLGGHVLLQVIIEVPAPVLIEGREGQFPIA